MIASDVELATIGASGSGGTDTQDATVIPSSQIETANNAETEANNGDTSPLERVNETSLAPIDTGFGAWSFLVAAFLDATITWGLPNSYGVFLVKYLDDPYWASQPRASFLLPLVGPLSSGIIYCAGPVTYPLVARFPRQRRASMWFGAACIFASLVGASYARTIVSLVALQGVLYAIGGALLYAPAIHFMSEWFVARRGLANGTITAGTSWGGLLLPLILPPLLNKYGIPKTLRFLGIAQGIILVIILPFIRGRLPESRVHGPDARGRSASGAQGQVYLTNKIFWFILLATLLQGLAYFIPILWLPSYASSLRLSSSSSSMALAFLNGGSIAGRIGLGMLSDRFSPWLLASVTLFCTGFSIFVLWGVLSYTFAGIIIYGITYGFLASGWSSLWISFVKPIAKDDPTMATTILGFLMLSRGIGNILSTPISTALQPARSPAISPPSPPVYQHEIGLKLAGGQYEKVIVYAGTCFVAAAAVIVAGWAVERKYPSSDGRSRQV